MLSPEVATVLPSMGASRAAAAWMLPLISCWLHSPSTAMPRRPDRVSPSVRETWAPPVSVKSSKSTSDQISWAWGVKVTPAASGRRVSAGRGRPSSADRLRALASLSEARTRPAALMSLVKTAYCAWPSR